MAQFTVNTTRFDPYKNFKFRLYFVGRTDPVAGLSKVGTLKRTTEVVKHREGGDPSPDTVADWIRFGETRAFVRRVLDYEARYRPPDDAAPAR